MFGFLIGLHQDQLRQVAGVRLKVALEDLLSAMDEIHPFPSLRRPLHASYVSWPLVQVESNHPTPMANLRKSAAGAVGLALAGVVAARAFFGAGATAPSEDASAVAAGTT